MSRRATLTAVARQLARLERAPRVATVRARMAMAVAPAVVMQLKLLM